jgi:DNA-binding transcriptional regulator YdaS (Cro superfamily)
MDKFTEWLSAERGRVTKLALALNITHGAVSQWRKQIPAERLGDVSRATGIPREVLRPDIFAEAAE